MQTPHFSRRRIIRRIQRRRGTILIDPSDPRYTFWNRYIFNTLTQRNDFDIVTPVPNSTKP